MNRYIELKNGKKLGMPDILRKQRITVKSPFERRIIYTMLQKAYEGVDIEKKFTIDVKYILIGNIKAKKGGHDYKLLKKACNNVLKIVVDLMPDDPKNFELTQIMSYAKYENKKLTVAFSKHIIEKIKAMVNQGNYTKVMHYCTIIMRSENAVNLYIMLKNKEHKTMRFIYSVAEMRERLGTQGKMKTWIEFKRYIIEKNQSYFEKHSDILYTFKPIRTGRFVTDVEFTISKNKTFFKDIPVKKELLLKKQTYKDYDVVLMAWFLNTPFQPKIDRLAEKYKEYVCIVERKTTEIFKTRNDIPDKTSYRYTCLTNKKDFELYQKEQKAKQVRIKNKGKIVLPKTKGNHLSNKFMKKMGGVKAHG